MALWLRGIDPQPLARPCDCPAYIAAVKGLCDEIECIAARSGDDAKVFPPACLWSAQTDAERASGFAGQRSDTPLRAMAFTIGE